MAHVLFSCGAFCFAVKERSGNDSVVSSWLAEAGHGLHFADQRNDVGGTIFAAGEWEEDYAERICAQSGGMRGEIGGDDSGDEGGDYGAEIGALKTKKRAYGDKNSFCDACNLLQFKKI